MFIDNHPAQNFDYYYGVTDEDYYSKYENGLENVLRGNDMNFNIIPDHVDDFLVFKQAFPNFKKKYRFLRSAANRDKVILA